MSTTNFEPGVRLPGSQVDRASAPASSCASQLRQPAQRSLSAVVQFLRQPAHAPASSEVADRSCASQLRGRCPLSAPASSAPASSEVAVRPGVTARPLTNPHRNAPASSEVAVRPVRQPAHAPTSSEVAVRPGVAARPLTNPHRNTMMR